MNLEHISQGGLHHAFQTVVDVLRPPRTDAVVLHPLKVGRRDAACARMSHCMASRSAGSIRSSLDVAIEGFRTEKLWNIQAVVDANIRRLASGPGAVSGPSELAGAGKSTEK